MKVALIQMNAGQDEAANLAKAKRLIAQACREEAPDLVMLPECFTPRFTSTLQPPTRFRALSLALGPGHPAPAARASPGSRQ